MITIHQFRKKYFFIEAEAPPAGAPPVGGPPLDSPLAGGATPPPPGGDLGGLGGGLGGAMPPPPGGDLGGLGGSIGGGGGGATQTSITDIKKLNAWDLLEKHFQGKIKSKDPLEDYL